MKTITYETQITLDGTCLPINVRDYSGCYVQILEACKSQMDALLDWNSRMFVYRFDLRLGQYTEDNKVMSDFMRSVRKMLKSEYRFRHVGFLWAREQQSASAQHYHVALFLNGNKINHPGRLRELLEVKAGRQGAALWEPEYPFYNVGRLDLASYEKCFYRLSYIAKERSKGARKSTVNDYSASRIKPRNRALAA